MKYKMPYGIQEAMQCIIVNNENGRCISLKRLIIYYPTNIVGFYFLIKNFFVLFTTQLPTGHRKDCKTKDYIF